MKPARTAPKARSLPRLNKMKRPCSKERGFLRLAVDGNASGGPISCSCKKWGKEHARGHPATPIYGLRAAALRRLASEILAAARNARREGCLRQKRRAICLDKTRCSAFGSLLAWRRSALTRDGCSRGLSAPVSPGKESSATTRRLWRRIRDKERGTGFRNLAKTGCAESGQTDCNALRASRKVLVKLPNQKFWSSF